MKKIHLVLLSITIVIALILTTLILTPPGIENVGLNIQLPSVINDLQQIASKPHSVADKRNLEEIKDFLVHRLSQMDLDPIIHTYEASNWFDDYEVHNITAQIDGAENAPYILVMAHYDSVMENLNLEPTNSTGMADDGYGVATLLHIAEYFSSGKIPLKNGIKFLLTDSEETGPLEGSIAELAYNEAYYQDVALVINLEGRSNNGPVFMFQSSASNPKLLNLLKNANYPVANSLMNDLFGFMPNFTDLSPFLENNYNGLNFSTLGHLKYYHSDEDNLTNLDEETLNHYLIQIVPIVEAFVSNEAISSKDYFDEESRYTYFNLLPDVIITYSGTTQIVIFLFSLFTVLVAIILLSKKEHIKMKRVMRYFAWLILGLITAIIIGTLYIFVISVITGITYNPIFMFNLKYDYLIALFGMILWMAFIVLSYWRVHKFTYETLIAGVMLNALLSVIMMVLLPGWAYIFIIPNFFAALFVLSHALNRPLIGNLLSLSHLFISVILFGTTLYIIYYALTVGILGILMFFITAILSTGIPMQLLSCSLSNNQ